MPENSLLPPGRRDRSGFWLPAGCEDPRALVRRRRRGGGPRRKPGQPQDTTKP